MKRVFTILLTILFTLTVYSQTETDVLKKAGNLIKEKKYESAFKVLQNFDKQNDFPNVVILKEEIALNYFVSSIMHQMFGFKDLMENEDIMDFRGKPGAYGLYSFAIDSTMNKLLQKYPDNYKLNKGLGDFYFQIQQKYNGQWLMNDTELIELIIKNYQVVIDHKLANDMVYYNTAYQFLLQEKYKEAIPLFKKSIELNDKYADAHYNLAYAYLFTDDRENAVKYAQNSLELYKAASLKSDAARIIARSYLELNDKTNALKYYELANSIDPENYDNLKPLISLYVESNHSKMNETMNKFFNLAPDNPSIYNDLCNIYHEHKKTVYLITFFESKLPDYKNENKILGNLNFYIGRLYLESDKKKAKEYFLKAKSTFSAVFDKDNSIFQTIDEGIRKTKE